MEALDRKTLTSTRRGRLLGWWYICIGAGFLLLGCYYYLLGERLGLVALRGVIGGGFLLLGWFQLRGASARARG